MVFSPMARALNKRSLQYSGGIRWGSIWPPMMTYGFPCSRNDLESYVNAAVSADWVEVAEGEEEKAAAAANAGNTSSVAHIFLKSTLVELDRC